MSSIIKFVAVIPPDEIYQAFEFKKVILLLVAAGVVCTSELLNNVCARPELRPIACCLSKIKTVSGLASAIYSKEMSSPCLPFLDATFLLRAGLNLN